MGAEHNTGGEEGQADVPGGKGMVGGGGWGAGTSVPSSSPPPGSKRKMGDKVLYREAIRCSRQQWSDVRDIQENHISYISAGGDIFPIKTNIT